MANPKIQSEVVPSARNQFLLPSAHNRIAEIANRRLSLDQLTRELIRAELGFRLLAVASPAEAFPLERCLQRGEWGSRRPILNPFPVSNSIVVQEKNIGPSKR